MLAMSSYPTPYIEGCRAQVQAQLAEKAQTLTPEMWSHFMTMQSPMLQGLMGSYVEQSKNVFVQMQEQMQSSQNMFGGFPFSSQPNKTEKE